jgi:hypothetical protein
MVDDTTEWARQHGHELRWNTQLDNHEPPRSWASGSLWTYTREDRGGEGIVIADVSELKDAHQATYIIDDGRTVKVFYVAAWHPEMRHVILHRLPTNFNEDGTPILRADDKRPVDYSNWMLGPRRSYHLKVREP